MVLDGLVADVEPAALANPWVGRRWLGLYRVALALAGAPDPAVRLLQAHRKDVIDLQGFLRGAPVVSRDKSASTFIREHLLGLPRLPAHLRAWLDSIDPPDSVQAV